MKVTKADVLQKIDETPNMPKGELKFLVNSITLKTGDNKPNEIIIGDVYFNNLLGHPCLVLKEIPKTKDYISISLTTTPKEHMVLTETKNRFCDVNQFVTNTITVQTKEYICERYMYTIPKSEAIKIRKIAKDFLLKFL